MVEDEPTIGDVATIERKKMAKEQEDAASRRTLKIWDVPSELANKFIAMAKSQYANKSWLLLQDVMRKADLYDQMIASGRLDNLEQRIMRIEELLEARKEENENINKPKVFGHE